jgi:hypothetical protein
VKYTGSFGIGSAQALMGYVLVPVILAQGAEWVAHAIQIVLACIAVLEIVRLALWFGFSRMLACAAGLLLVAIPPFLPMASTAMPDMLGLALGLTGMERFFAWKTDHRWSQALPAGLMLGLAPWARPQWVMLLPLASIWVFDDFNFSSMLTQLRRKAYLWTPVLLAGCVLLTVNLVTRQRASFRDSVQPLAMGEHTLRNLFAYFLYLAVPIPIATVCLIVHWRKMPLLLAPAVAFIALIVSLHPAGGLASQWAPIASLCAAPAIVHLFYVQWRRRDRTGLLLGLWMLIPLPVVFYEHFPIKYMMALLPAAVLIFLRTVSTFPRARMLAIYGATVFICTGYSCLILKADEDFAEYGRRAAAELITPHVASGEKVWYGGQWGYYWYAQRAGAEVSQPAGPGPKPGQLLAIGVAEGGDATRNRFPHRVLVDRRRYNSPHGRTMLFGAGLYSNIIGNALWVWNPAATNEYELWQIR